MKPNLEDQILNWRPARYLISWLASVVYLLFLTGQLFAAEPGPTPRDDREASPPADSIAPYDRNGDGKLDLTERAELMEQRRVKRAVFDTDRDGHLDAAERNAAALAWRQRTAQTPRPNPLAVAATLLRESDVNGDGVWDQAELTSFFDALIQYREEAASAANKTGN